MSDRISYIIATNPRTGSNWLCELLRTTGVAGNPGEYFWNEPYWAEQWGARTFEEYIATMRIAGTTPNGVFGLKMMWAQVDSVVARATETTGRADPHEALSALFPGLRYIRLIRKDRVRQAVSQARALGTGQWRSTDPIQNADPPYDHDQIAAILAWLAEDDRGWERFLAGQSKDHLTVHYEDLAAQPTREIIRILTFLRIPIPHPLRTHTAHERQADALTEVWVERFRRERSGGNADREPPEGTSERR